MHLDEQLLASQNFQVFDSLPDDFSGYRLPGATILSAVLPGTATIVQQEVATSDFTLRYNYFGVLQPLRLKLAQHGAKLISFLSTGNTLDYDINGIGNLKLKQGQFTMLHSPSREGLIHFFKAKNYSCMEVSWTENWLCSLLAQFNILQKIFSPLARHSYGLLIPQKPRPAGIRALDMATSMLKAPFDKDISRLFLERQAYLYLLLLLVESSKKPVPLQRLTERERETLIAMGEKIRRGFDRQFSIDELSREAGMNSMKLKTGFREIHGDPISRVHMKARMDEARRLIAETDYSTQQIASMVGYKHPTSFIGHFQKYFGYAPSLVQCKA